MKLKQRFVYLLAREGINNTGRNKVVCGKMGKRKGDSKRWKNALLALGLWEPSLKDLYGFFSRDVLAFNFISFRFIVKCI